ncbi:MAG: NAD(P)-binding domain-containing protein [Pseudomonadota bacterium]
MKIGFLGTGKIAAPMVRSIARRFDSADIVVSHRSANVSSGLTSEYRNVSAAENQVVLDRSDIVFLCLLEGQARDVLPSLSFRPAHSIVSAMAGITLADLRPLVAPADTVCVTVPLPFINDGHCPLPVYPQSRLLSYLFGDENEVLTIQSEEGINDHFAATAILSTVVKQLEVVSRWLGAHTGNDASAEQYVAMLVRGFINSIEKDRPGCFTEAISELTTKGGLNEQLLTHNTDSGHFAHLSRGLDDLRVRLQDTHSGTET